MHHRLYHIYTSQAMPYIYTSQAYIPHINVTGYTHVHATCIYAHICKLHHIIEIVTGFYIYATGYATNAAAISHIP